MVNGNSRRAKTKVELNQKEEKTEETSDVAGYWHRELEGWKQPRENRNYQIQNIFYLKEFYYLRGAAGSDQRERYTTGSVTYRDKRMTEPSDKDEPLELEKKLIIN